MKILALVVALFSLPAFAADYTPWSGGTQIAQNQQLCCVGNGCQGQFECCCPSPKKPTCVNAVITPMGNGNSSCRPQSCGSCQ
jgi:hypothetical protein